MSDALDIYKASGIADTVGKPFTAIELWKCLIRYLPNKNNSAAKPIEPNIAVNTVSNLQEEDLQLEGIQRIFVRDNKDTHAKIVSALKAGDSKSAYRLVHSLKSNAGFINENQLQQAAAQLEELLMRNMQGDSIAAGAIADNVKVIESQLQTILDKLSHLH
jgi:HPt (histidine-containing phosphotransfer) domain-containing protein